MPSPSHSHGARSIRHKGVFLRCVVFAMIHYVALVVALTFAYILYRHPEERIAWWLAGSIGGVGVTWLMTYIARRSARCPLCKGTPLLDTPATKHQKALRIKPLNYGMTAQLQLILSHRFRCMYCGTPFDLLRRSGQPRGVDSRSR